MEKREKYDDYIEEDLNGPVLGYLNFCGAGFLNPNFVELRLDFKEAKIIHRKDVI
jgi:hypothetical protein